MRVTGLLVLLCLNGAEVLSAADMTKVDTLAVIPFETIGDFQNPELFSHGLPDGIACDLALAPNLVVIERMKLSQILSELQLSQTGLVREEDMGRVGQLLGARILIVGTVQTAESFLRIHSRGVDTRTGIVLFSVKHDGRFEQTRHVFDFQDAVSRKILSAMGVSIISEGGEKLQGPPSGSFEAYLKYVNGIRAMDKGDIPDGMEALQKAADLDPRFQRAINIRQRADQMFRELDTEVEKMKKK